MMNNTKQRIVYLTEIACNDKNAKEEIYTVGTNNVDEIRLIEQSIVYISYDNSSLVLFYPWHQIISGKYDT